ncbi:hypothetical protein J4205_01850 [Candidatus Pacearchaeota archaeon]|nr:hypothetical protein [uncultured archaeon]MBS3066544.1 hypothetical protein [Candidatus Pacearchaeota archaeon]
MKGKRIRNEVKPGAFEIILGKEKSDRQKVLITLALYGDGKYGIYKKAAQREIEELMGYHNQVMPVILSQYKEMEIINGEVCFTSENMPPIPMQRWTNYLEHIERIKEEYKVDQVDNQEDYQI